MFSKNQYIQQKIQKVNRLRELKLNPYTNNIKKELSNLEFKNQFAYINELDDKRDESTEITLIGRVKLLRLMGKAVFAQIEDKDSLVQIYFSKNALGEEWFNELKKLLEVGDIISAKGFPFITKTGELSLNAKDVQIITKAISPLPEKFHGLSDKELRYRQRYIDMIMNPEVRDTFVIRSKIINYIRKFFLEKNFIEVETPILQTIAGGANAKPFITKHNALDLNLYLRIAPELYLKRLLVGGMEAIFEISRCFRNEGMDSTHNPEFTSIEFYWAYKTYKDLMKLTEELFSYIIKNMKLNTKIKYGEKEIDFQTPFKTYTYKKALIELGGVDENIINDKRKIIEFLKEKEIVFNENISLGHLQAELFDNFVEEKLINPTFITDFPVSISPLARKNDKDENIADRFELFIAGNEIANAFSELNDPIDQYERFKTQIQAKNMGDEEAHCMDEDYINALSYGMPPAAGQGIGLDRLIMIFTNMPSIRDVLLFPTMKPNKKEGEELC